MAQEGREDGNRPYRRRHPRCRPRQRRGGRESLRGGRHLVRPQVRPPAQGPLMTPEIQSATAEARVRSSGAAPTRARLLIADDQKDVLEALKLVLKGEGFD